MNGLLNIQVRVLSREAQALLKQLEKEIAAVSKATNGQSSASKRAAISQENLRNQTRALTVAQRELAAAQRAVTASQRVAEASVAKITAKQAAYRQALIASTNASAKLKMMDANSAARHAASAAAAAAETKALRAQTVAQNNLKKAKLARTRAREVATAEGSQPNLDRLKRAELSLANAKIARRNATDAVIKASSASAASEAKAAQAAFKLTQAQQSVTLAQQKAAAAAAELTAAYGRAGVSEAERTAAAQRLTIAQNEVTAAQQRATVASAAASKASLVSASSMARSGAAASTAAKGGFASLIKSFRGIANSAQWAGRQMQTNFTVPILVIAGFATKFALDNQKAMVMLTKVYGDGSKAPEAYKAETDKLAISMRLLSEKFGVQQKDVISIGASWAAAGAQGASLARGVQQTLRAMVVGEMEAATATKALISIQAQWRLNTDELTATMNLLNTVENQTGVNLQDLVIGFSRASGSARQMGVTQQELAADIAALVPAAGAAAAAGNGLKTIYTKLIAPTSESVRILHLLGIETDKTSWSSLTATKRLEVLASSYSNASRAQKEAADKTIFGNFQLSRASILLEAIAKKEGYRERALKATTDATVNARIADQELQQVLESNPQKLKQLGVILQNTAADLGTKLVPILLGLASIITSIARAFNKLDPTVRKMVLGLFLFLAVIGPIIRWISALGVLIGWLISILTGFVTVAAFVGGAIVKLLIAPFVLLSRAITLAITRTIIFAGVMRGLPAILLAARTALLSMYAGFRILALTASVMTAFRVAVVMGLQATLVLMRAGLLRIGLFLISWPGLIAVAVVGALILFRDQITGTFKGIVDAFKKHTSFFSNFGAAIVGIFNKLPSGIQTAMLAVVRVVKAAVMAVYKLFSYLNPFASHSPSLVENVVNGMAVIMSEFNKLPSIAEPINKAYVDIKRFKELTKSMMDGLDSIKRAEDLKNLLKYAPQAAGAFRVLVKDLQTMQPILDSLQSRIDVQQKVVDKWKTKLDKANDSLQVEKDTLDSLTKISDSWSSKLQGAQNQLSNFANAPLQGMRAMEDQIFANDRAQKQLQLQMMNMEDVVGPIDDLQSRMAALSGSIEVLTGTQNDLRSAGAGSDVLSVYDEQIAALEAQQASVGETASEYNDLKSQLEALQRQGQRMDLEKSLNFDGLQRQIDQTVNSMQEMPFDEIIAGVQDAKADVDRYTTSLDAANAEVDKQQKVVDKAQAAYDALNKRYEREQKHLDVITEKYNKMRDAINEVKAALDDVANASSLAVSQGVRGSTKGGGALSPAEQNFMDAAGGDFPIGGGTSDIGGGGDIPEIDKFNKQIADEMKGLTDSLDMFAPIKKQWRKFQDWWNKTIGPELGPMISDIGKAFKGANWSAPFKGADDENTKFMDGLSAVGNFFKKTGKGIAAVTRLFMPELKELGSQTISKIVKAFRTWKPQVENIVKALGRLWKGLEPLVAVIGGVLLLVLKVAAKILVEVFGRALDVIIDVVGDVLQVIAGLINFVAFIFTGDWAAAWDAIKQIFLGTFQAIGHLLEGIVSIIWGIIWGFIKGIIDFFVWLWDELVGHSIIPDMINAIVDFFVKMPGRILSALASLGKKLVDLIKAAWGLFMDALKSAWSGTYSFIKSIPQKIYDGFMLYVNLITSIGSKIIGWIKDGLIGAWKAVTGWVGDKIDWIVKKFGSIKDKMAGKFVGMFDGILDAFKSVANGITSVWNNGPGRLSFKAPGWVPFGLGGKGWDMPDIPQFASGGIAVKNQMHLIGEKGPELFIPGQTGQVLSNAKLSDLVSRATIQSLSMLAGAGIGATVRNAAPGQYAAIAAGADRRASMASTGAASVQATTVNNSTEYHFHGDLSFPNIKSGEDAEAFLTNLSDLAG